MLDTFPEPVVLALDVFRTGLLPALSSAAVSVLAPRRRARDLVARTRPWQSPRQSKNIVIPRVMVCTTSIQQLSDHDLLAETEHAAADERLATASLLALLGELDVRRLYLGQSCSSLFTYCTRI